MSRIKQLASFVLLMIYSVGIAHGAIPHSHYVESAHDHCQVNQQQDSEHADGLIHMLIDIFNDNEFTDIADFFVGASVKKLPIDASKVQLAAVLVSFITINVEEDNSTATFGQSEPDLSYRFSHISSASRRGPPAVS
ncbi:MAG: hypothetical protein K9G46_12980 [Flavobacteriales bacterium]|jgi:hypothetical protein|nr:hypothetical protein [Flavobacteriales bacterium]